MNPRRFRNWLLTAAAAGFLMACQPVPRQEKPVTDTLAKKETSPPPQQIPFDLEQASLDYLNWYLAEARMENGIIHAKVSKARNGKCELDMSAYFSALPHRGSVGREFLRSEMQQFDSCAAALKQVDFARYKQDAYTPEEACQCLNPSRWFPADELPHGLEVQSYQADEKGARVNLLPYKETEGKREYRNNAGLTVFLAAEGEAWKIRKIERVK